MLELHHRPARQPLSIPALKAEYDLLRQLHTLLQREGELLAAGQTAELPGIAASRETVAAALQSMARARVDSLRLAGIGSDAASIRNYLESPSGRGPVRTAWNTLRREYQRLEAVNRANGGFVETQLRYLQTRWNGLLQCAGNSGVYSSQGQSPLQRRSASLSAAA